LDALGGPDAKTPGILLAVLAMLLLVRRRWFWAGLCCALAFLVWQPLLVYLAVGLVVAGRRRLVALGAVVPLAASVAYFWITGALGDFLQAAFVFPVEGLYRAHETVGQRVSHIANIVALGDATPLVLTDRTNPSRYIYLSSGVAAWQLRDMPDGFNGWMQQIRAANPAVIVLHGWHGKLKQQVGAQLRARYVPAYVG